jgi:hypothetical protein
MLWTAGAAAAVALLAAGIGAGFLLRGSPATASATTSDTTNGATIGPAIVPGIAPGLAPTCTTAPVSGGPELCLSQPLGDGYTTFVIHGVSYVPLSSITVKLVGPGISKVLRDATIADRQGTFFYAIDQGHYFFPGGKLPPGKYAVLVTAPDRGSVSTSFTVNQLDSEPANKTGTPGGPQSGVPPPAGSS